MPDPFSRKIFPCVPPFISLCDLQEWCIWVFDANHCDTLFGSEHLELQVLLLGEGSLLLVWDLVCWVHLPPLLSGHFTDLLDRGWLGTAFVTLPSKVGEEDEVGSWWPWWSLCQLELLWTTAANVGLLGLQVGFSGRSSLLLEWGSLSWGQGLPLLGTGLGAVHNTLYVRVSDLVLLSESVKEKVEGSSGTLRGKRISLLLLLSALGELWLWSFLRRLLLGGLLLGRLLLSWLLLGWLLLSGLLLWLYFVFRVAKDSQNESKTQAKRGAE